VGGAAAGRSSAPAARRVGRRAGCVGVSARGGNQRGGILVRARRRGRRGQGVAASRSAVGEKQNTVAIRVVRTGLFSTSVVGC
jgi:hypothetical protein